MRACVHVVCVCVCVYVCVPTTCTYIISVRAYLPMYICLGKSSLKCTLIEVCVKLPFAQITLLFNSQSSQTTFCLDFMDVQHSTGNSVLKHNKN